MLFLLFVLYVILGFFGYGNDYDTYAMLKSGRDFWQTGNYHYSRGPGNLIPELVIGGASLIGGYVLTNTISSVLGIASLYLFWCLLKKVLSDSNALLSTIIVGLNPYFIIASSSSMDYVYSIFFCLAGIVNLTKRNLFFAAVLFAIAVSSRLSNIMIIGIVYLYYFYIRYRENEFKEMMRLFISGCLLGVLTILLFVPSYIAADHSFDFLKYGIGDWNLVEFLSRIIYKNIYLVGLLPFIFLVIIIARKIIKPGIKKPLTPEAYTGLIIIVLTEILFFKIPVEISYLLPLLIIFVPLSIFILNPQKSILYILSGLTFLYSFVVNPDLIDRKYNVEKTEAISAEAGLFIRRGAIIDDVMKREETKEFYWDDVVE